MQLNFSVIDAPRMAAWDFSQGFLQWRLWAFLGLQDIRQRYRRSSFGPLWLALGLGVTIMGIGILYSQILKTAPGSFVPYIAISLLVWNLISTVIGESTSIFQAGAGLITTTRVPYTTFVLRGIVRNLIVAAHCMAPVIITYVFYGRQLHWIALAAIPGLFLLLINLYWISLCIAVICLRYRDLGQIVIYATQLALFITPILWQPTQIRANSPFLLYNPFYHLLNLIRGPLFDSRFPMNSVLFAIVLFAIGAPFSAAVMVRFRRYLVFWI